MVIDGLKGNDMDLVSLDHCVEVPQHLTDLNPAAQNYDSCLATLDSGEIKPGVPFGLRDLHEFFSSGIPHMCGGYSRNPQDSEHCYSYDPGNWEIKFELQSLRR